VLVVATASASAARADDVDRASALASPFRLEGATAPRVAGGVRRFSDGHGAELSWADDELDLRPAGLVHFGVGGGAGLLTATSHASLQPDLTLGVFLDVAIVPSISLHVRLGAFFHGRFFGASTTGADGRTGHGAIVAGRVQLLVGAHLWQLLALRAGFELGPSDTFDGSASHAGLGWALVSQIGIRLADGGLELLVEPACDAHELTVEATGAAPSWGEQPSLRLSILFAGEI
jgi:hypothetical protein